MKYSLLKLLVCPVCQCGLTPVIFLETGTDQNGPSANRGSSPSCAPDDSACGQQEIIDGMLVCSCGARYAIAGGIPVMIPEETSELDSLRSRYGANGADFGPLSSSRQSPGQKADFKTAQRFGYEWLRYPVEFADEEEDIFFQETQLQPSELNDKLILDAGCGMGRFTRVAGRYGGEVVGVDLSRSVVRAYQITRDLPGVHIVQADLMCLPFRKTSFDIIYSLGVLHHTPDTQKAFASVAGYVKSGGLLSMWVYGTAGRYADFKSNPLRPDRLQFVKGDWVKPLYWLLVLAREKCSNALRRLTVSMPHTLLYACCYLLALAGAVPILKYLTFSAHHDWRVRLLENFDWLSPPYQYHHTKEEVRAWYEEHDMEILKMLRHGFIPKVGFLGRCRH